MTASTPKMTFDVSARRLDAHGSQADCMLKGIERVTPILQFELRGVEVRVHGVRQDAPPRMASIRYDIVVDTDESDPRLGLLHEHVKKYGTVFNTVSPGADLAGTMRRKSAPTAGEAGTSGEVL